MSLPILVIGAGGHGRVVADALRAAGKKVLGFLDSARHLHGKYVGGLPVLGGDECLQDHPPASVGLANGIGSTTVTAARRQVYERLTAAGFEFETVRHPAAIIAPSVVLSAGAQVMAGAVLQPGVIVGEDTIINTGALVDHDCVIGSHCHLAPGVVLSGTVRVGDGCHIGTAASVIQGITIGPDALIAAGAVVVNDVSAGTRMAGMPARAMEGR